MILSQSWPVEDTSDLSKAPNANSGLLITELDFAGWMRGRKTLSGSDLCLV